MVVELGVGNWGLCGFCQLGQEVVGHVGGASEEVGGAIADLEGYEDGEESVGLFLG